MDESELGQDDEAESDQTETAAADAGYQPPKITEMFTITAHTLTIFKLYGHK